MTLVEVLLLVVGPAIAKAIAKVWLKDAVFAQETTKGLVGFLKDKVKHSLACLETAIELDPAVKQEVEQRLGAVVPAEVMHPAHDLHLL